MVQLPHGLGQPEAGQDLLGGDRVEGFHGGQGVSRRHNRARVGAQGAAAGVSDPRIAASASNRR